MYVSIIWISDLDKIWTLFVKHIAAGVSSLIRSCHLFRTRRESMTAFENYKNPKHQIRDKHTGFCPVFVCLRYGGCDRRLIKVQRDLVKEEDVSSLYRDLLPAHWSPEARTCCSE